MNLHHRVPFEQEVAASDEVVELRDQRRQLRQVCDMQRRELVRLEAERDRLAWELEHCRRQARKRWWRR